MRQAKRTLAALLTVALLLGMLPAGAANGEEIIIEAENASPTTSGEWGIKEIRNTADSACSGGKFFVVQGPKSLESDWAEFTLTAPDAGTYDIYVTTKDNRDRTIFQFSLDGKALGSPVDLFRSGAEGVYREHKIGTASLGTAPFKLRATALPKSSAGLAESTTRSGVFDFFRLVPAGKPEPGPAVLYQTDFSALPAELSGAEGWSLVSLKSGSALQGVSGAGSGLLATLTSASQNLPEAYTVVLDMQLTPLSGTAGYSGGLTLFHTDNNNFYHYRIDNGTSSTVQLRQWVNGSTPSSLGTAPLVGAPNGAHCLRVTVDGGQIVCYMDGQQTAEHTAAAADSQLGLRVYNGSTLFDNLTVYEGVVPPPAQGESAPAFELAEPGPAVCHMTLSSAGVTKSDGWSSSSLTGFTQDSPSIYSGTVGQYVQFKPSNLAPGWYEVAFWNIAKDQSFMKMTGTIHTKQEDASVQPTAMTANGWNTVGSFYFSGTGDEYFRLTVTTAGAHSRVADVRFTQTGDPGHESTVWHDEDSSFQSTGAWTTAASPNGSDGSGLHITTELSATAAWSNYPPSTGNFGVYYWIPEAATGVTLALLSFDISSLNGNWKVSLNPNGKPSGWTKLCTVSATAGTALSITMSPMGPGTAYADSVQLTGTSASADPVYTPGGGGSDEIAVLVNQIGYDNGKPKRASVPNAANGMPFKVCSKTTGQAAFSGQVAGGIADFSSLETTADTDFYITCGTAQSYDFTIGTDLIQRRSVKNALAFMGETRSDTFEVGVAGIGWRDSHQFSFELNGMVLQYMANPSLYENLPHSIPQSATCEYPELRTQDEPDLVWLIQFAALRYYDWGHNKGKQLHMLTKEQLAYYLYLYPEISQYVPKETYEAIRDYTISVWGKNECTAQWYPVNNTNHDLYSVQTAFGGLKGSQPPGHSIVPNLLMYEVSKRDGLGDEMARRFFDAAFENCEYTITGIDINDPFYNKGQRMSEYITVPALAYFLELYPDQAPAGLKAGLERWAEKTIARSNNQWDIRMAVSMAAGDGAYAFHNPSLKDQALSRDYWTGAAYANADRQSEYLSGGAPRNEPGNQAGLQAVTYAAARILDDAGTKERLTELGVAAIDDLFGRNPTGRAAFYDFTRDFEGADLGWYKQFTGGNGVLERRTAVIDANAPELCYPYAPENYNTGYTEGWVAYNTAWNASLAYAAADAVSLSAPHSGAVGAGVTVSLRAPLNLDPAKEETGTVVAVNPLTGERTPLTVTETGTDSAVFEGIYTLPNAPYVTLSYGSGLFRQAVEVTITNFAGTPVTGVTLSENSLSLSLGETLRLTAGVTPENATDKRISFTSGAPAVAAVTADGLVRAVATGSAVITAASVSDPSVKASCTVTVSAAGPQSLQLSVPATLSVFGPAGTAQVTGVVYSDGRVVTDPLPQAVFSTEQGGILRVTPAGILTALAGGNATVTATAEVEGKQVTGSAPVIVTADISYDLLTLYRANQYTTSGVTTAIAAGTNDVLTASYGGDRLKLTGNQAGNTISFPLSTLPAGTYSVTLYTKYFGGSWAYGVWSFRMDGKAVGVETNFNDPAKNGAYYDLPLGQVTLEGSGPHSFTFVSSNGGTLVPVSLRFTLVSSGDPDPNPGVEPGQTSPKIHSMDGMYQKVYTDTAIQSKGLNYRLYVPASYEHGQAENLPLLIYLNGAGSRGTDNVKQIANLSPLITPLIDDLEHPCIILVPQLPESDKWVNVDWGNGSYADSVAESNSAKLLMGLIGELKEAYQVDESRVYLMGQSFGGYGTWDLITRHPETFAAAVPMCGAGSLARAQAIKDLPLLVLHGDADSTVPVSGSRQMVAALQAAGSTSVTYLEYPGDDHYVQRRLFEQPELYLNWLFAQEKGKAPTAPDISGIYLPKLTLNLNSTAQLDRLTVTGGTAAIGGEALTITPESASTSVLALVKDTGAFTDGLLTAHFTMEALTGPGGAGLVLRAQDANNYIHLRFTKTDLNLLEMVGGTAQRNVTVPYILAGNRITCMKAEVRGSALKVWIDNVLLYDTTIQTHAFQTKGMIGVRSYSVSAKVDDLIWATRSGPSITLTSMTDRQVYQRDMKTGTASVTLAGTVSDAASLRARVVSWASESTVLLNWCDIPLGPDGSFSTALTIPQGGWYKTQLAAYDSNGVKRLDAESGRWGVGINILCIGQSNMVGIGQGEAVPAHDLASNFMNEHWTHLADPYDRGDTTPISSDGTTSNSMVPALANALIAEYGLPVGIIPAAKGGAGLVCDCDDYPRWLDRTEGNPADRSNLYGNSLYRAQAAGGVEFILMNQGEHDVSAGTGEEEYLAALNTLISNYRTDLGWNVPFLYCQLGPAKAGSWGGDRAPYMDGIRAAQMRANDPANGVILAAVELDLSRNSDNLHYTTASQSVIGRRVANAIRWYYDDTSGKVDYYTGPSISGVHFADQSRAILDVSLTHTGGSDFTPTAGITGFTVTDDGTPVTVVSARQKDPHTITLTLAAPVTGAGKVRYMAGLLPDVTGIVKDTSPMALPLNATVGALTVAETILPSIALMPTEATLYVNGENTLQLTAEPSPPGIVTWTSSKETVATVSGDGLVTAVSGGTAVITASAGGVSAQCTVTVEVLNDYTPIPITPVTIHGGGAAVSIAPSAQTSGGTARAHLTASDASRLLSAAKKRGAETLIIAPKVRGTAGQVSVTLSAGAAATLAGSTLIFQLPGVSITLPSGSLDGHEAALTVTATRQTDGTLTISTGLNGVVKAALDAPDGNVAVQILPDGTKHPLPFSLVSDGAVTALIPGDVALMLETRTAAFGDVPRGNWAAEAISFLAVRDVMRGTPDGSFAPDAPMTRAMLAVLLARLDGSDAALPAQQPWYGTSLAWAVEQGVLQGDGRDLVPEAILTREQMCTLLVRYLDYAGLTLELSETPGGFTDADAVSAWAADAVEICLRAGLLTGKPGGRIDPQGKATRAEVTVILTRFIEKVLR